jgi:hypothetical protein
MNDFVYLFRSTPEAQELAMGSPESAQKSLQKWLRWVAELESKGQLKDPGQPLDRAGKVVSSTKKLVTDGPYAESKDVVLGFMVVQARDLHEAVEISKGCPIVEGGGSVEIRPVIQLPM